MIEVLAHPGHWAVQLAYLSPLAVLVVALVHGKLRERREAREGGGEPEVQETDE